MKDWILDRIDRVLDCVLGSPNAAALFAAVCGILGACLGIAALSHIGGGR